MQKLEAKLEILAKKLEEKKSADELAEFERVRREAKEEAAKGELANIDILNQKLVLLESMAVKLNHTSKTETTMILSRFHANKANPGFAAQLILKLLSTKEEESILDKEQKMLKQYTYPGMVMRPWGQGYDMLHAFPPQQHIPNWRPSFSPRMRPPMMRPTGLCFKCKSPGHQIRNCPN